MSSLHSSSALLVHISDSSVYNNSCLMPAYHNFDTASMQSEEWREQKMTEL